MPTIRHRIALIAACTRDVRCAYATCAVDTQWPGSHTRHHTQWHRHSCGICAACASPMRHWYAVDTQHMQNSCAGDVPPNHLGDLSPINRQPVANQSPTSRQCLLTAVAHYSPTGLQLVGDWSPIDLQLKRFYIWRFWSHRCCICWSYFWSQASFKQVAVHMWLRL